MPLLSVFAVEWGNEFPMEIDSLWTSIEEARKRAVELNAGALELPGNWHAQPVLLRETWAPEVEE